MNSEVDLSIIVPIYNVAPYLEQCLKSLCQLTGVRYECILVDDGSTDHSPRIAASYAQHYPDRFIFLRQEHRGQGAARNLAIRHARGMYLGFVDADDWVTKEMFHKMLASAIKKDADLVFCNFFKVTQNGESEVIEYPVISSEGIRPYQCRSVLLNSGNGVTNKIIKRSIFANHNIRFPEGIIFEDFAIIPFLISRCDLVVAVPEPLYHYRIRSDSSTHTPNEKIYELFDACNHLQSLVDDRYREEVCFIILREIFFYALPRYINVLGPANFALFHAKSTAYAQAACLQWTMNAYVKELTCFKRIYLSLSLRAYRWPIKILSRLKQLKSLIRRSRSPLS